MTVGYYGIPPSKDGKGRPRTEPFPFCRACADRLNVVRVMPIDETDNVLIKCRGCKVKLREWR